MTRMRGSTSKDLGRRTFGTVGGWETSREAPGRSWEVIDPEGEVLRKFTVPPVSRPWRPRAGRICNFPVRRDVEEK
ncbi:MAG: hypothetical protein WC899_12980 [bacterium]|jgi:hypothetical protein